MTDLELAFYNKNKIDNFLREYPDLYTKEELDVIRSITWWDQINGLTSENIRQLGDELGLLKDRVNVYDGFAEMINDKFDINRCVVEVGSGKLPRLAIKIRGLQTQGEVRVYDPSLIKKDYGDKKLILKREMFSRDTIVPKDSLIVSFMPCEYTGDLIEYATNNKHDFIIALCGCNHYYSPYVDFDDSLQDWYANMEYLARRGIDENGLGEFVKTNLSDYKDPYPILYNKRK